MERAYHITARGNERRAIFRDDRDRCHFLELLAEMVERFAIGLHCYVLMDNHYHLVVEIKRCNLSLALQWLNLSYSTWFNRRHERSGHLFQGRFKSILFSAAASALEVSRYVHLNPVRIGRLGLGKSERASIHAGASPAPDPKEVRQRIDFLRGYRWSSYGAYIGTNACPAWLDRDTIANMNRGPQKEGRKCYRRYVEMAVREGLDTTGLWSELKEGVILGTLQFVQRVLDHLSGDPQEQRAAARLRGGTLGVAGRDRRCRKSQGAAVAGVSGSLWRLGARPNPLPEPASVRDETPGACGGVRLRSYGCVAMAVKRYEHKLAQDPDEARRMNAILTMLNVKM